MKTLLVPVDFSPNSREAAQYALGLALDLGASLVLLHAYDPLPPNAPAHEWLTSTAQAQYYSALEKLHQLRNQLQQSVAKPLPIQVLAQAGSPETVIHRAIGLVRPSGLVMSLTGDHPLWARQEGSLATGLLGQTAWPVLIVPPGVVYRKPQNLLLGIDLSRPLDALALARVIQFAHRMQAVVDVICVDDQPTTEQQQAARHIRHLLGSVPHTLSFVGGYDLATAFEQYETQYRTDLVILFPMPHPRWQRWLVESDSQAVARLSARPVLATC